MHHDEPSEDETSLLNTASRAENTLVEINTRIARLAMSLNAPLATEADIQSILNRESPFLQPHARERISNAFNHEEGRVIHQWEELRGLLMLRCELMTQSIRELGLKVTLEISSGTEAELEREGFKPGAEGFNMLHRITA
jgi:hypothetical protein